MNVKNYINGQFVESGTNNYFDIHNPATGEVIGKTPMSTSEELRSAVVAAKKAFQGWSRTPAIDRVQPLFKLKSLLESNGDKISEILVKEHGKTFKEAKGDSR